MPEHDLEGFRRVVATAPFGITPGPAALTSTKCISQLGEGATFRIEVA
jgi:hypothetical protein